VSLSPCLLKIRTASLAVARAPAMSPDTLLQCVASRFQHQHPLLDQLFPINSSRFCIFRCDSCDASGAFLVSLSSRFGCLSQAAIHLWKEERGRSCRQRSPREREGRLKAVGPTSSPAYDFAAWRQGNADVPNVMRSAVKNCPTCFTTCLCD